ncbi:Phospho-N-acetylmuramoyl-pentapeptide-transferase [uncultured archaeon]|nr:Phospho-N-acetylmuramoyl-pentapeptide-transferase [uncultured archaeon]
MSSAAYITSAVIVFLSAFFLTYFVTPVMIRKMLKRGITGKDMNKAEKPEVAEMGGISIMLGLSLGIIMAIFISTYTGLIGLDLKILLASFLTILLVGFIGIVDDLIGWRKGIRQWQHALFPLFAALPLMAVNAGTNTMMVPFFGQVHFGLLYSLLLVPIAITGASNAFNMLAGFNGLEAGLGIIIVSTLSLIAFIYGKPEALIIGIAIIGALIAFLRYNWFPAKVFGGDSLTLMIGAGIATISIVGNMEKLGLAIIALHWVELGFKAKHNFQSQCFGIPDKHGFLSPAPQGGSLTHIIMALRPMTEKQVVFTILGMQAVVSVIVFVLFYYKLF